MNPASSTKACARREPGASRVRITESGSTTACPSEGGLLQALCPKGGRGQQLPTLKTGQGVWWGRPRAARGGSVHPGTQCRIPGAEGILRKRVQLLGVWLGGTPV